MKSLVEEASTIAKAVEKAWERAGKPETFSVKIYEQAETNFLGFVKRSAKVGIFFEEVLPAKNQDRRPQGTNSRQPQHRQNNNQNQVRQERTEHSEKMDVNSRPVRHNNNDERPQQNHRRQEMQPRNERREESFEAESGRGQSQDEVNTQRYQNNDRPERSERPERNDRMDRRPQQRRPQSRRPRPNQEFSKDAGHQNPLVQPYAGADQNVANPVQSQQQGSAAPIQQPEKSQAERPSLASVTIAQPQRKVLKVSGRRYVATKVDKPENS